MFSSKLYSNLFYTVNCAYYLLPHSLVARPLNVRLWDGMNHVGIQSFPESVYVIGFCFEKIWQRSKTYNCSCSRGYIMPANLHLHFEKCDVGEKFTYL